MLRSFLVLCLVGLISACANPIKKPTKMCEATDWYEIGRRDGIQGLKDTRFENESAKCEQKNFTKNKILFLNGYNAGLAMFCTEDNAFEIGRSGKKMPKICPKELQRSFYRHYKKGLRAFKASKKQAKKSI